MSRRATRQITEKVNVSNATHSKTHEWDVGKEIHVREIQRMIGVTGHISLKDEDSGKIYNTTAGGLGFNGLPAGWYIVVPQRAEYKSTSSSCYCTIV
jgi:hypothetical protein